MKVYLVGIEGTCLKSFKYIETFIRHFSYACDGKCNIDPIIEHTNCFSYIDDRAMSTNG